VLEGSAQKTIWPITRRRQTWDGGGDATLEFGDVVQGPRERIHLRAFVFIRCETTGQHLGTLWSNCTERLLHRRRSQGIRLRMAAGEFLDNPVAITANNGLCSFVLHYGTWSGRDWSYLFAGNRQHSTMPVCMPWRTGTVARSNGCSLSRVGTWTVFSPIPRKLAIYWVVPWSAHYMPSPVAKRRLGPRHATAVDLVTPGGECDAGSFGVYVKSVNEMNWIYYVHCVLVGFDNTGTIWHCVSSRRNLRGIGRRSHGRRLRMAQ